MEKQYVEVNALLNRLPDDLPYKASVKRVLMQAPTVDVVEKEIIAENEKLRAEIAEMREFIGALTHNNADLEEELAQMYNLIDEAKASVVKKMLDMLMKKAYTPSPYGVGKVVDVYEIHSIVEDMMEEYDGY